MEQAEQLPQSVGLTGRYIAAISDADFLASTYKDGKLPKRDVNLVDRLSIITLPLEGSDKPTAQINTSNSVTAAPFSLSISPNGKMAFVLETLGPPPPGATLRKQLPPGRKLVAVDLSNPRKPTIGETLDIGSNPETVDVHPNGNLLAITTQMEGKEVILVPVRNGKFGKPKAFSLRGLDIAPNPNYFQNGMYASYVQWHPSGRYLAVNLDYRNEVVFYELRRNGANAVNLVRWGEPLKVGKDPYSGQFTPDGRFYITTNWMRNFGANITTLEQRLPTSRGTLSVARLANVGTEASRAQHRVVFTATSDLNPEGITISPDGSLVATVNMRGTLFPQDSPRFTHQASLSLLRLNHESGRLTKVGDYPFEGILPENASFDASGNYLAVAVFDYFTSAPGGVEIWRVVREPSLALERTDQVIDVGRGTHQVVIVP
jgi:6-phosphogluconolactonase (cycloisomerase 2 family)